MKHIVVLSGAGISAESGIKTFRDADGLWEGHDVMKVASPEGFHENPELVLDFYNQRRRQLLEVQPNAAHYALAELESEYQISIITQNVDDLHERAGSTEVLHLHGELLKSRNVKTDDVVFECIEDIKIGNLCADGHQLRPHIVWFGESVPMMDKAVDLCMTADILIIIGTSLQVYPAAGLMHYVPEGTPTYLIDPRPTLSSKDNLTVISKTASEGMKTLLGILSKSK